MEEGFRLVNAGSRRFVSGLISVLLVTALWAQWSPEEMMKVKFAAGVQVSPDGTMIVFSHVPSPSAYDWTRADISTVDVSSAAIKAFASTNAAETSPEYFSFGFPAFPRST